MARTVDHEDPPRHMALALQFRGKVHHVTTHSDSAPLQRPAPKRERQPSPTNAPADSRAESHARRDCPHMGRPASAVIKNAVEDAD
jgi:hypothetical protein